MHQRTYLWGDPVIAPDGSVITVRNLHVEGVTQSAIDKLKVGLAKLLLGDVAAKIESKLQVDLAPKLNEIRATLSQSHDAGPASLRFKVDRVAPQPPAFSKKDAIGIWAVLEGTEAKISFTSK
jgi:Domain of unknown function (DUF4403)